MRRDITFLALGGGSLLLSFFAPAALPVNPAWLAILLCGAPIVREAAVGLFTRFDIRTVSAGAPGEGEDHRQLPQLRRQL